MDQNSTSGSGKSNWREKLGIGTGVKDMPKASKPASEPPPPAKSAPAKPSAPAEPRLSMKASPPAGGAPRAPQTVAKPAPMAPRAPAKAAAAPAPAPRSAAPVQPAAVPTAQGRIVQRSVPEENPLAEKLRAQREAAERAAEQRVLQARDKAVPQEKTGAPQPAAVSQAPRVAREKPKFTFAEEELVQAKREGGPVVGTPPTPAAREYTPVFQPPRPASPGQPVPPPMVPPRTPLGAAEPRQRPAPEPRPRPPASGYQPQFSPPPQPQPGYRPLDPPGFKRPPGPAAQPRGYAPPPPANYHDRPQAEPRLGAQREAYEAYRKGMTPPPVYGEDEGLFEDQPRAPQRPVPARVRAPVVEEDANEVFEDELPAPPPPPRRRASAQEYNQAYREFEEDLAGEDNRRSSGPWLLLGLLLLAAIVTAGGVWFYQKSKGPSVPQQATTGQQDQTPVVPAPEQPAKVVPDPAVSTQPDQTTPTAAEKRKQIYDRIVGEQEVEGTEITPTVEQPLQPEAPAEAPAATAPAEPEPSSAAPAPIPEPTGQDLPVQPDAGAAPATQQLPDGDATEPLPLPLPPPPGDQQGALPSQGSSQTVAAASSTIPEPPALPQVSPASASSIADVPASSSEAASQVQAALPEPSAQSIETPPEEPAAVTKAIEKKAAAKKPVEKKATAKKAKPAQDEQTASLGTEPVVLVPPAAGGEATQAAAPVPAEEPAKSGSFFDFSRLGSNSGESPLKRLKGKSAEEPTTARRASDTGAAGTVNEQQVASVEPQSFPDAQSEPAIAAAPEPAPAPAPAPEPEAPAASSGGGSGFVAQLASFRSEAEALAEFKRLQSRHPSILGNMSSRVSKGTVGGVTRYRLGVGPMGDKASADGICNKLIAAGERDCLAKRL